MTPEETSLVNILQTVKPESEPPPTPQPPPAEAPPPPPTDVAGLLVAILTKISSLLGNHPDLEGPLQNLTALLKPNK